MGAKLPSQAVSPLVSVQTAPAHATTLSTPIIPRSAVRPATANRARSRNWDEDEDLYEVTDDAELVEEAGSVASPELLAQASAGDAPAASSDTAGSTASDGVAGAAASSAGESGGLGTLGWLGIGAGVLGVGALAALGGKEEGSGGGGNGGLDSNLGAGAITEWQQLHCFRHDSEGRFEQSAGLRRRG